MKNKNPNKILKEQVEYYKARAPEYDEWFLRTGRYDHGPKLKELWFSEVEELKKELKRFKPKGEVLELACGTGWWTEQLARYAKHITAVDASSEVLVINKKKLRGKNVSYIEADLFNWLSSRKYDVVFFSFWLSHVPPEQFDNYWKLMRKCLNPDGRIFFIDSLKSEESEKTYTVNNPENSTSLRKLNDGRTFNIVKVFYQPEILAVNLKQIGWNIHVKSTENYFLYGYGNLGKRNRL